MSDTTTQATKIYRAIKDSGMQGIPNYKLARIALKYSSRIAELRKDGHTIVANRVYAHGRWTGTWNYYLASDDKIASETSPSILDRIRTATIGA